MADKKNSVLIIENDPPTLELYCRELGRVYTVLTCQTEDEAVRLASSVDLHAIVLEPAINSGAGWALLSTLSRQYRGRRIPIVLISTQDERLRGIQQGAAVFLLKPVLPTALCDVLHRFGS